MGSSFCYSIVQVDQFDFFPWTLKYDYFSCCCSTFFKTHPFEQAFGPVLSKFKTFRLLLSPYSIKDFATTVTIEKVAFPPL